MTNKERAENNKFADGILWNYISLFILAGSGFVFSLIIGIFYDASTLGVFNTAYAYYIVMSQFCVCGCHMAVTKYCAEYLDDRDEQDAIFTAALGLVIVCSFLFVAVAGAIINYSNINNYISTSLRNALNCILPALIFFPINKVILGVLNGRSRMRAYAFFQAVRNVLIAFMILLLSFIKIEGDKICLCFLVTELILLGIEIVYLMHSGQLHINVKKQWLWKIMKFGLQIMPANIVLELNTKIDVICLSMIIQNDEVVGIYSFAALFAEGFYQLFVVIRRSLNPKITKKYLEGEIVEFYFYVRKKIGFCLYTIGALAGILLLILHYIGSIIMKDKIYLLGMLPLLIIVVAIEINIETITFGNILSQTGFPIFESIINIATALSNVILNIFLIQIWGMIGAAIATGVSYFVYSIIQHVFVRKKILKGC